MKSFAEYRLILQALCQLKEDTEEDADLTWHQQPPPRPQQQVRPERYRADRIKYKDLVRNFAGNSRADVGRLEQIRYSPDFKAIWKMLPPGTKFLAKGRDAIIAAHPDGQHVFRISFYNPNLATPPRFLHPEKTWLIGPYLLELLPKAYTYDDFQNEFYKKNRRYASEEELPPDMKQALQDIGDEMQQKWGRRERDWSYLQIGKVGDKWHTLDRGTTRMRPG